jgi:amphiphysin
MQRAQRTFGRFLKRAPNEADVEAMLTDFTDSESMLEKVCTAACPMAAAIRRRVAQA